MRRLTWYATCCTALVGLFLVLGCGKDPAPAKGTPRSTYDKDGNLLVADPRPADAPNLIVVLIDTLRADAVALPGDNFETRMPYLSSLAREGVSFSNAAAPASWTIPSITSFLTGVLPHEHGVNIAQVVPSLNGRFTTMPEALRNGYGYETLGYSAGPWFDNRNSIWQGFRTQPGGFAMRGAKPLLKRWVDDLDPNQPFFMLLHTFEAHDPYGAANHPYPVPQERRPPEGYIAPRDVRQQAFDYLTSAFKRSGLEMAYGTGYSRNVMRYLKSGFAADPDPEMAAELEKQYFAGVTWVDGLLKETVQLLQDWKLLDDTLLVITSDHGEAFGEHGTLEHGRQLYDELVRIPLVMIDFRKDASKQRFRGGRVFHGPTALIDVLPTFFAYAGLKQVDDIHGRPFLDRVVADDRKGGDPVFSEEVLNIHNTMEQDMNAELRSARSDRWKYILTYDITGGTITEELYDLQHDPEEQNDLSAKLPEMKIDASFCAAVEAVRDSLWGAAKPVDPRNRNPYHHTRASVDPSTRPAPCATAVK